ncbi:MAG: hypothetical protein JXL80_01515 [Planctomycetes bacterium]|nr:hypothetical protein [Planctomycetota bacterium]
MGSKRHAKRLSSRKPSKAYTTFERVVERSLRLLRLQESLEDLQRYSEKKLPLLSDLSRAAIVLAVAAMDAYFTDVFAENFVRYLKAKGPEQGLTALLSKAGLDTRVALELLNMQKPNRRIRTLVERYHERTTTQRAEAIDELFIAYGIKDFCKRAQGIARRKNLLASIRILVNRRHEIVHDGDINSHGSLQSISSTETRRRVQDVVKFVAASEELLAKVLP